MGFSLMFFINSALFGIGLAMDAFSVSLAVGMTEPDIRPGKKSAVAGTFAGFQMMMPLIGWFCVHSIASAFGAFQKYIPFIALALLLGLGVKMIIEGIRGKDDEEDARALNMRTLPIMGIATSIDALSVGFTIAEYSFLMAFTEALIIGAETFVICTAGLELGRKLGTKLAGKASILGGVILIAIGLEIFLSGVVFK